MDADDTSTNPDDAWRAKLEAWRADRAAAKAEANRARRHGTPAPPKPERPRLKPPPAPTRLQLAVRDELRRQQAEQTAETGVAVAQTGVLITASQTARRASLKAAEAAHADAIAASAHDLAQLARTYTTAALDTLYTIMQDTTVAPAARVSAAAQILDRGHGKPAQSVQVSGPNGDTPIVRVVHQYVARGGEVIEGAVVWAGTSEATS